jgi:hypothetical protein
MGTKGKYTKQKREPKMERLENIMTGLRYIRTATLATYLTDEDLEDLVEVYSKGIERVKDEHLVDFLKKCAYKFEKFPTASHLNNFSKLYYNESLFNERI